EVPVGQDSSHLGTHATCSNASNVDRLSMADRRPVQNIREVGGRNLVKFVLGNRSPLGYKLSVKAGDQTASIDTICPENSYAGQAEDFDRVICHGCTLTVICRRNTEEVVPAASSRWELASRQPQG